MSTPSRPSSGTPHNLAGEATARSRAPKPCRLCHRQQRYRWTLHRAQNLRFWHVRSRGTRGQGLCPRIQAPRAQKDRWGSNRVGLSERGRAIGNVARPRVVRGAVAEWERSSRWPLQSPTFAARSRNVGRPDLSAGSILRLSDQGCSYVFIYVRMAYVSLCHMYTANIPLAEGR
jgi:hypothetical protein